MSGFVTEIPEELPAKEITFMLRNVGEAYKSSRKAKKNPADSIGDLIEVAPAKLFKEVGMKKPKGPIEFCHVSNRG